jgi:hypothetical protein
MTLRIARGLFRLCIIVSALWIGGVIAVTWWTFPPAALSEAEVGLNTRPTECDGKSNDQCMAILTRLGQNPLNAFDPLPPPLGEEPQYASKRRSAISFAAIAALVPPLVLLTLGGALGWAFSGFRSE